MKDEYEFKYCYGYVFVKLKDALGNPVWCELQHYESPDNFGNKNIPFDSDQKIG